MFKSPKQISTKNAVLEIFEFQQKQKVSTKFYLLCAIMQSGFPSKPPNLTSDKLERLSVTKYFSQECNVRACQGGAPKVDVYEG